MLGDHHVGCRGGDVDGDGDVTKHREKRYHGQWYRG